MPPRNDALQPRVTQSDGRRVSKRALEVADQIEISVGELKWEAGAMVGDETALMERYDVGRSVFRQAIRLSEHLGVAIMRRGRSGGLAVAKPTPLPAALSLQIAWSKQRVQPRSAARLRDALADWDTRGPLGTNVIYSIVALACEGFDGSGSTSVPAMDSGKLGEQIAQNILTSLTQMGWDNIELLGSEADLMAQYSAGRASLREAVHLLELHGVAVMQRGPGGGLLVLRAASAGALSRSLRAQLRSGGHSDVQIVELLRSLLVSLPAADLQNAGYALRLGAEDLITELDDSQTPLAIP